MHLVEIDVVHLEPAQTGLDLGHDMAARQADLIGRDGFAHENIGVEADFGRDYQIFSPLAENSSKDFLRRARRINIGGIEKISADLDEPVENFCRGFFVSLTSKRHASKAKLRNFEPGTT